MWVLVSVAGQAEPAGLVHWQAEVRERGSQLRWDLVFFRNVGDNLKWKKSDRNSRYRQMMMTMMIMMLMTMMMILSGAAGDGNVGLSRVQWADPPPLTTSACPAAPSPSGPSRPSPPRLTVSLSGTSPPLAQISVGVTSEGRRTLEVRSEGCERRLDISLDQSRPSSRSTLRSTPPPFPPPPSTPPRTPPPPPRRTSSVGTVSSPTSSPTSAGGPRRGWSWAGACWPRPARGWPTVSSPG